MSEKKEEKKTVGILDRFMDGSGPIRDFFRQATSLTEENLLSEQEKLVKAFREGIAEAIGIPPDYIKEEAVTRWFFEFARAFVRPEHLKETITPPIRRVRLFGQEIGQIVREGIEKIDEDETDKEKLIKKVTREDRVEPQPTKKVESTSDIAIG